MLWCGTCRRIGVNWMEWQRREREGVRKERDRRRGIHRLFDSVVLALEVSLEEKQYIGG